MDVAEQLKNDVREGRLDSDRLVELLVDSERQLQVAHQRIAELEQLPGPTPKVDEPFSLRSEEKRQQARGKKKPKDKPQVTWERRTRELLNRCLTEKREAC
ncbi:MAG: hypothetical protein K8U57_11355 [Planctomycetes bacterium]|nr:hypothetical protein [Planctomycetota bacterium]